MSAAMPGMLTNNTPIGAPPTINTPLGNHGWADEFSQKISMDKHAAKSGCRTALEPPNLGHWM